MPISVDRLIQHLSDYVRQTGSSVDLILVGGLALQAYGFTERVTFDVDGEFVGDLNLLVTFFQKRQVPVDLGENMSGWSVIAMPPGYRERATVFYSAPGLSLRLLDPLDFVIAKLRRGTEQDLEDAEFVARRFQVPSQAIKAAAESAVAASPKDTALFLFRKTTDTFCERVQRI